MAKIQADNTGDQQNQGTIGGQTPQASPKLQFKRVSKSYNAAGGAKRGRAKVAVSPTGATRSNSDGKAAALKFVRDQGGDPNNFELTFGGSEELGQIALYLPEADDPGAMKVSQYKNAIAFHMGAVFDENPLLRPAGTVDCSITPGVDADGEPCLLVNISGGTPTRTVRRKQKGQPEQTGSPAPQN